MTETDCAFLLRCLSDGRPHTLNELLQRSIAERGCGLTVHSRAADLRKQGYRITNRPGTRKRVSIYQLEPTPEEAFGPGTVRRIERANIAPLCSRHHLYVTERRDKEILERLAESLTDDEYAYCIGKLGEGALERLFGVLT